MDKAFMFDWSGTLMDNFHVYHRVSGAMFKELGKEPLSEDELRRVYTTPYMKFWNSYFPDLRREVQDAMFQRHWVAQTEKPALFPGVLEMIEEIHKAGYGVFVISSDPQAKLEAQVNESGLFSFIEGIKGEDHDKEDTAKFFVEKHGLSPSSSYFVGDCTGDIEAGKSAGMKTVALAWGFESRDRLSKAEPDYIFDEIAALHGLIAP